MEKVKKLVVEIMQIVFGDFVRMISERIWLNGKWFPLQIQLSKIFWLFCVSLIYFFLFFRPTGGCNWNSNNGIDTLLQILPDFSKNVLTLNSFRNGILDNNSTKISVSLTPQSEMNVIVYSKGFLVEIDQSISIFYTHKISWMTFNCILCDVSWILENVHGSIDLICPESEYVASAVQDSSIPNSRFFKNTKKKKKCVFSF